MTARNRPPTLPKPTRITQPFWDAARKHALHIQRCSDCQRHVFYPRALCPHCGSAALTWVEASGRGTIYTFTVARKPTLPTFTCPYVIAIVELAEGPHVTTNIVECDPDKVRVGDPVEAVFQDADDKITLVHFRPARA